MSRTSLAVLAVAALAVAASPRSARAHGVVAQVDRRDGSVAVRLRYHDGPPLAGATFEIRSPRGGDAPFAEGRTDRHGWVAFTPDAPGTWTVKIADATGHGRVVDVKVESVATEPAAPAAAAAAAPAVERQPAPPPTVPPPPAGEVDPTISRIVAGALALATLFGVLFAVYRSRRAKGP